MVKILNKIPKTGGQNSFDYPSCNYVFYCLPEEKTELFYGIELELSSSLCYTSDRSVPFINTNFIFTSYDASIFQFGTEFKNHPATFRFLKKNWVQWYNIFKQKSLKAHDTCGIHVHLSRKAFDEKILFRFVKFIYDNKKFSFLLSGRKASSFDAWSRIEYSEDSDYLAKAHNILSHGYLEGSKRNAITVNMNGRTVEVRLFASTKKPLLFWKNLEFCDCLYYFCKHIFSEEDLTVQNFINYLSFRKHRYKNLYTFIMANFCSEITGRFNLPDYRQGVLLSV